MDVDTAPKPKVYVALDLEKAGDSYLHPITEIGFVMGTSQNGIVEKKRWSLLCNDDTCAKISEPLTAAWAADFNMGLDRCKTEFWNAPIAGNGALWNAIQKEARPAKDVYPEVAAYIDSLYKRFHLRWVSDNPCYDLGHLDFWLLTGGFRLFPCRIGPPDVYHKVRNPEDELRGLPTGVYAKAMAHVDRMVQEKGLVAHRADDDAAKIFFKKIAFDEAVDHVWTTPILATGA